MASPLRLVFWETTKACNLSCKHCRAVPQRALEKLVFGTNWYAQAEHGGFYQAQAEGIYRQHGLEVEIRMGGPQINGLQLLLARQMDVFMGFDFQTVKALEQDLAQLQAQVKQAKARTEETKQHAAAVEKGRGDADAFLARYFMPRRIAPTALLTELNDIARRAGIQERGNAFSIDLIEGSESLGMVTITATFEGTYRNLLNFVREIDRSPSLLIIESLNAAPQQGSNNLMVAIKMEAFLREDGSGAEQIAQTQEGKQ